MSGPDDQSRDPTVVYLLAYPRSGTTILGNVLGEIDGWTHAGEVHDLWSEGLPEPRRRCGCGQPVERCDVWRAATAVLGADGPTGTATIAHGLGLPEATRVVAVHRALLRRAGRIRLLCAGSRARDLYAETRFAVHRGLALATGARIVVDSSKLPADAGALIGSSVTMPIVLVHVTRDPRAVVTSRLRRTATPRPDTTLRINRGLAAREAVAHLGNELHALVLRRRAHGAAMHVRYEDFVQDPLGVLRRIASLAGDHGATLPLIAEHRIELSVNHTVSGNRNRWAHGPTDLIADLSWRRSLRRVDRGLLTLLSSPALTLRALSARR